MKTLLRTEFSNRALVADVILPESKSGIYSKHFSTDGISIVEEFDAAFRGDDKHAYVLSNLDIHGLINLLGQPDIHVHRYKLKTAADTIQADFYCNKQNQATICYISILIGESWNNVVTVNCKTENSLSENISGYTINWGALGSIEDTQTVIDFKCALDLAIKIKEAATDEFCKN